MKAKDYLQRSSSLFSQNRILKFCFIFLSFAFCYNSMQVSKALHFQRTVLIPPKMSGEIEFLQGKPTERYIKDISRTIANLAGTYSPSTARENYEALLYYYHPSSYPQASERWYSLASRAEEGLVSSVFYLEDLRVADHTIELFGQLVQYTGSTPLENTTRTYLVDYLVEAGRFYINSIKEKALKIEANATKEKEKR